MKDGTSPAASAPGQAAVQKTLLKLSSMQLHIAGREEVVGHRGKVSHFLAMIDPQDVPYLPPLGASAGNKGLSPARENA